MMVKKTKLKINHKLKIAASFGFWIFLIGISSFIILTGSQIKRPRLKFTPPPDETMEIKSPKKVLGEVVAANCLELASLDILVDKDTAIPADFVPSDLVLLNNYRIPVVKNDLVLKKEAAEHLETLVSEMAKENYSLLIYSAFRSFDAQKQTYLDWQKKLGEKADRRSALPGHSEHQLGTAFDLAQKDGSYIYPSKTWNWLDQNAHKFGFVMSYRYPQEKQTGYDFEPWHWRYVGIDLATKIRTSADLVQQSYRKITCN